MNMLIRFFILMMLLKRELSKPKKPSSSNKQPPKTVIDSTADTLNKSADLVDNQSDVFEPFTRSHRILPHDMGFRDHLPNYRYLSFIELNITGWLTMLTYRSQYQKLGWVIAMQEMVYLKEIKLWNRMTVTSKLEGLDSKYLYFQHHFYVKNTLMAIGLTKFVLTDEDTLQKPQILGLQHEHLTEIITTWNSNQQAIKSQ